MNILVCVSIIPAYLSKVNLSDDKKCLIYEDNEYIINPYDQIALARAIEIVNDIGGSVTAITIGTSACDKNLYSLYSLGVSNCIRIDTEPTSGYFVAKQISEYAKLNNFDLILTGRESSDFNGAQVAGMIGELLQIPSLTIAKSIDFASEGLLHIIRETRIGKEMLECKYPLVISCAEGVSKPKTATIEGVMSAKNKKINIIKPIEVTELSKIEYFELANNNRETKFFSINNLEDLVVLIKNDLE